jgi:hypothetical protein
MVFRAPSSFCSMATAPCANELFGLLLSLSMYHKNAHIVCVVDSETKKRILSNTPKLAINIVWEVCLDEYSKKNRKQMEYEGIWSTFQMMKAKSIEIAVREFKDTLFLDSDIFVLAPILIDDSKQLGISPHYIRKRDTDRFGYYNGGALWTSEAGLADAWRTYTKTSRFYDQASIEDLARQYTHFEFDESHNFSWWRVEQSDESPQKIISYLTVDAAKKSIKYKGKELKFVHTHFTQTSPFNTQIMEILMAAHRFKDLMCIFRMMTGKWKITIPKQPMAGIWSHNNDSFRELAVLMETKCKDLAIEYSDKTHHVLLSQYVLLYDRPTMQWFDIEATKMGLIYLGNNEMKVEGNILKQFGLKARPWTFWARRPAILEGMITEGVGSKGFSERNILTAFIGNIENKVQEKNRTGQAWEKYVEFFICTRGSSYVFTHREYLDKLSNAKFGLTLRGFGSKCHREVELMALGTVPIITPGVDISSYLDPPQKDKHYIYVEKAEDIPNVCSKISEEKWTEMSNACKEWYMKNGHSTQVLNNLLTDILY